MKRKLMLSGLPLTCLLAPLPLSALAAVPSSSSPSPCTAAPADAGAVAETVRAFYEAERTGDSGRWRALTTPDFYMFHEGENMPPENFVKWIDHEHELMQKNKPSWWTMDISDLRVSVDCTAALTTQTLHNVMDAPNAPSLKRHPAYDETFLESYWLRKAPDGRWKIAFWNVSKVPKARPAAAGGLSGDAATPPRSEGTPAVTTAACAASPADTGAIAETYRGWYDAVRTGDVERWRALTTPDLYLFHEGIRMPVDDFVVFINKATALLQKDDTGAWTIDVSDLQVSVDCNAASATAILHIVEDLPKLHEHYDEHFLDSVWLRKTSDGRWRIAFWHATKASEPLSAGAAHSYFDVNELGSFREEKGDDPW